MAPVPGLYDGILVVQVVQLHTSAGVYVIARASLPVSHRQTPHLRYLTYLLVEGHNSIMLATLGPTPL